MGTRGIEDSGSIHAIGMPSAATMRRICAGLSMLLPKVTGLILALSACTPPPASGQMAAPTASRSEFAAEEAALKAELTQVMVNARAANEAQAAGNQAEAARLRQKAAALQAAYIRHVKDVGERKNIAAAVDPNSPANRIPGNFDYMAGTAADRAGNFSAAVLSYEKANAVGEAAIGRIPPDLDESARSLLSGTRFEIGRHYEKGLGVAQDYHTAALWYEKAIDGQHFTWAPGRLGFLYANGLGVPRDRQKARELFKSLGAPGSIYYAAVDYDLLPRTLDDWTPATTQAVTERDGKEKAARAARVAAGLAAVFSVPATQSQPRQSDPWGRALCNKALGTSVWNFMSPCNQ